MRFRRSECLRWPTVYISLNIIRRKERCKEQHTEQAGEVYGGRR